MEKSRHDAIVEMLVVFLLDVLHFMSITTLLQTINPDYKKPPDYNEPTIKITDKVMIPQV